MRLQPVEGRCDTAVQVGDQVGLRGQVLLHVLHGSGAIGAQPGVLAAVPPGEIAVQRLVQGQRLQLGIGVGEVP